MSISLKLKRAINVYLKEYLCLTEDESILIISDTKRQELSFNFFEMTNKITQDSFYLEIGNLYNDPLKLPNIFYEAAKAVDTILFVADMPIMGSPILRKISDLGVRVAVLPLISEDALSRCMITKADELLDIAKNFELRLQNAENIRIETKSGTNLTLPVKDREIFLNTGILKKIGETGYIPSGKIYLSPIDEMSYGTLIVDCYIQGIGLLKSPVKIEIENGMAVKIYTDSDDGRNFQKIINQYGEDARNIAEFGLGINPKSLVSSDFYETESSFGTCFVAFGGNIALGGKVDVPARISCIIQNPSIFVDDKFLLNNGKLVNK